jgi:hypothetical protein
MFGNIDAFNLQNALRKYGRFLLVHCVHLYVCVYTCTHARARARAHTHTHTPVQQSVPHSNLEIVHVVMRNNVFFQTWWC